MDKARAMRVACARIAAQVRNELDVGGYAVDVAVRTSVDERRLRAALERLETELLRRAGDE